MNNILKDDDFDSIIDILNVEWELRWIEDNRAFLVKGYGEDGFQTKSLPSSHKKKR